MFHGGKGNAVKRWRLSELPPCDLLRSLHYDIRDFDCAECVRAEWMWSRKPKKNSPDLDTMPNKSSKTAEEIRLAKGPR
jgi:hypothetical protein